MTATRMDAAFRRATPQDALAILALWRGSGASASVCGPGVRRVTARVEIDRPWASAFWTAVGDPPDRVARHVGTPGRTTR